ncbi:MAG: putative phage abortive infection protein [Bacteroidota bacterium]
MNEQEKLEKKKSNINKIALGGVIFVLGFWIFAPSIKQWFPDSTTDQFNAVTSLFSALSVAGVIYAILLQSHELELQRNEIKHSTEQLRDQKIALQEQSETMRLQQFESTFTTILKAHREFVSTLAYQRDDGGSFQGVNLFTPLVDQVIHTHEGNRASTWEQHKEIYQSMFLYKAKAILPYFRSLDAVLKYIERSHLTDGDKSFYTSIIDAQLTSGEHGFIRLHIRNFDPVEDVGKEILARLIRFQPTAASLRK